MVLLLLSKVTQMHFCQRANKNAAVCDCLRSCGELVRLSPKCMPPIAAHTTNGRYFLHKICRLQWWRTFKTFTFSPISNPSLLFLHCLHRNVSHSCKYLLRKNHHRKLSGTPFSSRYFLRASSRSCSVSAVLYFV